MRTSNKILLGTFLLAVLIITGIQVVLYAKIRSGDLVVFDQMQSRAASVHFEAPNIKHVLVIGMGDCVVNYSDTARITLSKDWKERLKWRINGDSLVVEPAGARNFRMGERVGRPVVLSLPADVRLHAKYTDLTVLGANDSATASSLFVSTEYSHVFIIANADNMPMYWKKLAIANTSGEVIVSAGAAIQQMELRLDNNAVFNDNGAKFDSLSVSIDSTSAIHLRAGSLEKIKLIKQ